MDLVDGIVNGLVAVAVMAAETVLPQAVRDAYDALKRTLLGGGGEQAAVLDAVQKVEEEPGSAARQALLREEVEKVAGSLSADMADLVTTLHETLRSVGVTQTAGDRSVQIGGSVKGANVIVGNNNTVTG
jgi:hypothetical protein